MQEDPLHSPRTPRPPPAPLEPGKLPSACDHPDPLLAAVVEAAWSVGIVSGGDRPATLDDTLARLGDRLSTGFAVLSFRRNARHRWVRAEGLPFVTPDASTVEDVPATVGEAVKALGVAADRPVGAAAGRRGWLLSDGRVARAVVVGASRPVDDGEARRLAAAVADLALRAASGATTEVALEDRDLAELRLAHRRVLDLLLEGLSEPEMARRLSQSVDAVHGRVRRIYKVAGVGTRAKLMAKFVRRPVHRSAQAAGS